MNNQTIDNEEDNREENQQNDLETQLRSIWWG